MPIKPLTGCGLRRENLVDGYLSSQTYVRIANLCILETMVSLYCVLEKTLIGYSFLATLHLSP